MYMVGIFLLMNYHGYSLTQHYHNLKEQAKRPGQEFCDKYNWKISNYFEVVQRPDKITWCGGTMYRTQTPTTHIWYESKKNKNHHIWVEFNGTGNGVTIIVKDGISISRRSEGFKTFMTPNPEEFKRIRHFNNGEEASQYIINSYNRN